MNADPNARDKLLNDLSSTLTPASEPILDTPPAPPVIPDHELIRRIGRGSYGEVWLARNALGTWRAVKIVQRAAFDHDRPYEREFEGIRRFEPISRTHPSQLNVLHVGRNDAAGHFYYVMELADAVVVPGVKCQVSGNDAQREETTRVSPDTSHLTSDTYTPRTLRSDLYHRGHLPFDDCLQIGLALATALDHLHRHGLVHRDIKPSNIIFVNGISKLADIGLVARAEATLSLVGTEGYLPPEGPGTPQADIFSLGKVLYEMATGRDRQEFPELPTNLIAQPATERAQLAELNEIIIRACHTDLKQRYQTAAELHAELALLQSGKSVSRMRTVERRLRFLQRAGAFVSIIAVIAAGLYFWQTGQARRMRSLANESRQNELLARESLYAADIGLAYQALMTDNFRQARNLLKSHVPKPGEPDLRGWEWRYLWQSSRSDEWFSLPGHTQTATSVAFSPDGRLLVTGSYDGTAKIWDLASRRLMATLKGQEDLVESVCFSPRGSLVATASKTALRVWDATTFQLLRTLPQFALKARFSPDGHYLAAGGTNLVLWDTQTWQPVATLGLPEFAKRSRAGHYLDGPVFGSCFSPDGRSLAIVLEDGVRLLGIPDLREQFVLNDHMPRNRFATISPDGQKLATCAEGNEVKLWDLANKRQLRAFSGHSGTVDAAAFSADGRQLVTCSLDQTLKLWDVASGKLVSSFRGHADEVWDVSWAPDGKLLASVSKDGAVKLWHPADDDLPASDLSSFLPLGFDPNGNLVGVEKNGVVGALDPKTRQILRVPAFQGPRADDGSAVVLGNLSTDGHTLALPKSRTPEMELWDLQQNRKLCSVESRHAQAIFAPRTHRLATGTSNDTVTVWQLPQGRQLCILTNASLPVAFSLDGRLLATEEERSPSSEITVWRLEDYGGRLVPTPLHRIRGFCPVFSPDGQSLACSAWGGVVRLIALPAGQEIATLVGHKRDAFGLCFSPDGRTLATLSDDGTLRLWHIATRRELMKFNTPRSDPVSGDLKFSPDGRTLVARITDRHQSWTRLWFGPSLLEIAEPPGDDSRLVTGPQTLPP